MRKQHGQMAIFIAFIFQILFVFFAMAINVGMMVHDKINLQNSIDLAAYYGAQRQAEVLNVIAHTNYQIRQSWKLLSWRIRAMGDAARTGHPAQGNPKIEFGGTDGPWSGVLGAEQNKLGICVTNQSWTFPGASADNICARGGSSIKIPQIPQLQVAFFPWDFLTQGILADIQSSFLAQCKGMGQYNFYMTIRWMAAYRMNIGIRQKFINKMAEHIRDFKDIKGESIEEGMLATLRANLTRANLESLQNNTGNMRSFNSMANLNKEDWLPTVKILPFIPYTDIFGSGDCNGAINHITQPPQDTPNAAQGQYEGYAFEPPAGADVDYHSTKGVEKNPWYMVYTGAKATTAPRKPFFPFGRAVNLEARAFAQPFGGRIGPWSKQFWQREPGHAQSGEVIDKLLPPKFTPGGADNTFTVANIPNYSRFPNDEIGLKSSATLATSVSSRPNNQFFNIKVYDHLPAEATIDPLAKVIPQNQWMRNFEVAAVSPDVFDVQYYSIQPKFYEAYLQKMTSVFTPQMPMPLDYGSNADVKFSVLQQIQTTTALTAFQKAYFVVNNWENVLTSWAPNGTIDYTFPEERFGKCPVVPDKVATDSNCIAGGRSGYSVKLVSKNFLDSNQLVLGGDPNIKGPIFNPPTDF